VKIGEVTMLAVLVVIVSVLVGSNGDLSNFESVRIPLIVGLGIAIILTLGLTILDMKHPRSRRMRNRE
jgi:hypothetical protein